MYKNMSDVFIQFVVFTFYPKHMGYCVFFQWCRLFLLSVLCIKEKNLFCLEDFRINAFKTILEAYWQRHKLKIFYINRMKLKIFEDS